MSIELRAVLYFIFLLYLFLGIAIIADIFMSAIETITSRRRKIRYPDPDSNDKFLIVEVPMWNATVANLTLMALGSSSPEILLSIIEIVGNRFEAGELGPGTSKTPVHLRKQKEKREECSSRWISCVQFANDLRAMYHCDRDGQNAKNQFVQCFHGNEEAFLFLFLSIELRLGHVLLRLFRLHLAVHRPLGDLQRRGRPVGSRGYIFVISISCHLGFSGRMSLVDLLSAPDALRCS